MYDEQKVAARAEDNKQHLPDTLGVEKTAGVYGRNSPDEIIGIACIFGRLNCFSMGICHVHERERDLREPHPIYHRLLLQLANKTNRHGEYLCLESR
jgi:hypothetical protein